MNKDELLLQLKAIKNILIEKYGINDLALYGSYSKNNQTKNSDIDLVIFSDKKNYFHLIEMENYISEILNQKIDLGYYDSMKSLIKREISKDMIYVW